MEKKVKATHTGKKAKVLSCLGNIKKNADIARLCGCSEAYVQQVRTLLNTINN